MVRLVAVGLRCILRGPRAIERDQQIARENPARCGGHGFIASRLGNSKLDGFTSFLSGTKPMGIQDPSPWAQSIVRFLEGYTHMAGSSWIACVCILETTDDAIADRSNTIGRIRSSAIEALRNRSKQEATASSNSEPIKVSHPTELYLSENLSCGRRFEMIEADGMRLGWTSSIVLVALWS